MSRKEQRLALIELARRSASAKAEEVALLRGLADELERAQRLLDKATAQARREVEIGVKQKAAVPRAPSRYPSRIEDSAPMHREDLDRIRAELDRNSRAISQSAVLLGQVLDRLEADTFDQDASRPTLLLADEIDDDLRDT